METRNQRYARAAYDQVTAIEGQPVEKKYGALALNFRSWCCSRAGAGDWLPVGEGQERKGRKEQTRGKSQE
jgi:hypothetical protein